MLAICGTNGIQKSFISVMHANPATKAQACKGPLICSISPIAHHVMAIPAILCDEAEFFTNLLIWL